jgi:hypothetical protein
MSVCSGCDATWNGEAPCHCSGSSGCHRTFGSLEAFDRHLVYPTVGKTVDRSSPPSHADPAEDPWYAQNSRGHWTSRTKLDRARTFREAVLVADGEDRSVKGRMLPVPAPAALTPTA